MGILAPTSLYFPLFSRQLEGEIAEEFSQLGGEETEKKKLEEPLMPLIESIIKFDMKHNAEIQACDLLMEIDHLSIIERHMDKSNYLRVCLYISRYRNVH